MAFEKITDDSLLEDLTLRAMDAINVTLTSCGYTTDPEQASNMIIAEAISGALKQVVGVGTALDEIPKAQVNYPYQALAIAMTWLWKKERANALNQGAKVLTESTHMKEVLAYTKALRVNDPDPKTLMPMRATVVLETEKAGKVTLDFNQLKGAYTCPDFVSLDEDNSPSEPRYTSWYRVDDMLTQVTRHLQAIERSQVALRNLVAAINK